MAISVFYSDWQTGVAAPLSRCMVKQRLLLTVAGRNRINQVWRYGKIRGSYDTVPFAEDMT